MSSSSTNQKPLPRLPLLLLLHLASPTLTRNGNRKFEN